MLHNLYITVGTILIAVGGLVATHGWNLRSDVERKNALVRAMAAEIVLNVGVVRDEKLTKQGKDFVMFPRVHHVALDGALGSGLFTSVADQQLLSRATTLREFLVSFNQRLEFTENRMADNPNDILTYRTKLSNGKTLASTRDYIVGFGRWLMENGYVESSYEPFSAIK